MPVYVDPLFATEPSECWPYSYACHLTADTPDELHTFAQEQLGLQRAWYQPHPSNPACCHYDLTANKRRQALRAGAIALMGAQMAERILAAAEQSGKEREQ